MRGRTHGKLVDKKEGPRLFDFVEHVEKDVGRALDLGADTHLRRLFIRG